MKHLGTDVPTGISLNRKIFISVLQALDYIVMSIFISANLWYLQPVLTLLQLFVVLIYILPLQCGKWKLGIRGNYYHQQYD